MLRTTPRLRRASVVWPTLSCFLASAFVPQIAVAEAEYAAELRDSASEVAASVPGLSSSGETPQLSQSARLNESARDLLQTPDPELPALVSAPSNQARALPTGADKSGVTSQAISVPQGSGKIEGMGESFSTQLSTGAATLSVPFAIPAPRGGVQIALGVAYSSTAGAGVAGMGWEVGVPFIARQTDRGVPGYEDGPDFNPNQDGFVFNGGQELVPICSVTGALGCSGALAGEQMPPWSAGSMYFRPRVEGAFQRFFWSPDRRTWRVQDKTGVTLELGVPLDGSGDTTALETNPDAPHEIYKWHLVRQYDTYGNANPASPSAPPAPTNVVVYRYFQSGGMAYLSDIFHTTPRANPTSSDLGTYAHHVRLAYQPRTDPTFSYRSGWLIERLLRLERVDVASKPFNGDASDARRQVRRYHLTYEPASHVSLLSSVEVEGRCSTRTSDPNTIVAEQHAAAEGPDGALPSITGCPRLPPMKFGYTPDGFDHQVREIFGSPRHSVDEELSDLFDVDSDALPDVLVTAPGLYGGGHAAFFNGVGGVVDGFGSVEQIAIQGVLAATGTTIKLSNANVAPLDLDGDATINLLHMPAVKTYAIYSPERVAGLWTWVGRTVTTASQQDPKIDFGNDRIETKLVDVNFDGLVDVVMSVDREFQTFFSLGRFPRGNGQFGSARLVSPVEAAIANDPVRACAPWSSTPVRLSDPDVQFAEMNGDGVPDLVRVRRGDVRYWPGRGNGMWGIGRRDDCPAQEFADNRFIAMASSPNYSDIEATTLRIDDVNGDGLDDLVQVRFDAVDVWLNIDGLGWAERHIIPGTPASPSFANRVRLVDVNGSGTRDVLWGTSGHYEYIDLQGGRRPWLLTRVTNGLGKSTDIEYTTSVAEMLTAEATGGRCAPDTKPWASPWCSKMPVVAHVVKRTTESDNLVIAGKPPCRYVTEYTYRDPVFEARQREFRGFAKVRTTRIGDENSPTDFTDTSFLLGECADETADNGVDDCAIEERWRDNPKEALKGLPVLSERYDERGVYLSTEATEYRLRRLYVGLDGREVRHVFESGRRSIAYDTAAGRAPAPLFESFAAVELELTVGTITTDRSITLPVRASTGYAIIESSSEADFFGNGLVSVARGCTSGQACLTADEGISSVTVPFLPPGQGTGWLWRTQRSFVTGSVHTEQRRDTTVTYNAQGDPELTTAVLFGTVQLERFRAGGGAVALSPEGASQDGPAVMLSHRRYDSNLGLLTHEEGPNGRCRDLDYDAVYADLPTVESIFRGGCGNAPLISSAAHDRGLAVVTVAINMQGQPTFASYDALGRPSELRVPHPSGLTESLQALPATMKVRYFLPDADGRVAYSVVHTATQDGPSPGSTEYLDTYAYMDGFGRALLRLNEADPSAGDGGSFIGDDFKDYDNKLALRRKYLPFFTSASPLQFPLDQTPTAAYARQRYDAFGRQFQTFDLDGTVTLQSRYHALSMDAFDAADLEPGPHQNTPASIRKDGHGRVAAGSERVHVNGVIEERQVQTEYLPTGEPTLIRRVRVGQLPPVTRWLLYDSFGRMVLNVEPNTSRNFVTTTQIDPGIGPTAIKAWRYAYNDAGDLVGTSDARGCGVNFRYDGVGRLLSEDYSPCELHHAAYTPPSTTVGSGLETLYIYDTATAGLPSGFAIPQEYAATSPFLVGKLAAIFDRGAATFTTYDGRERIVRTDRRIARPDVDPVASFNARYAQTWFRKDYAFDGADREVAATTGSILTELGGEAMSSFGFPDAADNSVVTIDYTRRGSVKGAGGSYGVLVNSIGRAADNLIHLIEYGDLAATSTAYSYDDRRRLESVQTYRGAPESWPPSGSPTTQLLLQDEDFAYDAVGNPVEIRDFRSIAEWPSGAKPASRKLQYDDLYRVTRVAYEQPGGGDTWVSPFDAENSGDPELSDPRRVAPNPHIAFTERIKWQSFEYDWLGNTSKTDDDAHGFYDRSLGTIINGAATDKPCQLQGASNATGAAAALYDATGNLTRLNVQRNGNCLPVAALCSQRFDYQWDEIGRLVRARRWDVATLDVGAPSDTLPPEAQVDADLRYAYDASGERVLKTTAGSLRSTVYVFDSLELRGAPFAGVDYVRSPLTEVPYLLANELRIAHVLHEDPNDGEPPVGGSPQHVLFEIGDHLGSTSIVFDRATSEVVERATFQAYGSTESDYRPERWEGFREDYRLTGKEEDAEVGLQYFGVRFYAPLLGRWISADPLALHAPLAADANLYAYVSGHVLRAVDPLGLAIQDTQADRLDEHAIGMESVPIYPPLDPKDRVLTADEIFGPEPRPPSSAPEEAAPTRRGRRNNVPVQSEWAITGTLPVHPMLRYWVSAKFRAGKDSAWPNVHAGLYGMADDWQIFAEEDRRLGLPVRGPIQAGEQARPHGGPLPRDRKNKHGLYEALGHRGNDVDIAVVGGIKASRRDELRTIELMRLAIRHGAVDLYFDGVRKGSFKTPIPEDVRNYIREGAHEQDHFHARWPVYKDNVSPSVLPPMNRSEPAK